MYTIYLFFLDVQAAVQSGERTMIQAMRYVIERQDWTKEDIALFRNKVIELQKWLDDYLNERW